MQNPPEQGIRYDEYEPQKYNCISVDDDYVEIMNANLKKILNIAQKVITLVLVIFTVFMMVFTVVTAATSAAAFTDGKIPIAVINSATDKARIPKNFNPDAFMVKTNI